MLLILCMKYNLIVMSTAVAQKTTNNCKRPNQKKSQKRGERYVRLTTKGGPVLGTYGLCGRLILRGTVETNTTKAMLLTK